MIMKKTNLFLLLLLSNSFAFACETVTSMEIEPCKAIKFERHEARYAEMDIESSDDESSDNELGEITEQADKEKVLEKTIYDPLIALSLHLSSCSLHVPESDATRERRSSDGLRTSTCADRMHETRYNENIKERDTNPALNKPFTDFPIKLSGQKRGLTPPQEDEDVSSPQQKSPQRPKPAKRRRVEGMSQTILFPPL